MNALDPCPDDLLARAANAPLAPNERDLLAVHLGRCEACRAAADVTGALATEPSVLPGDELLIARLAERTAGTASGGDPAAAPPAAAHRRGGGGGGGGRGAMALRSRPSNRTRARTARTGGDRVPANRGAARHRSRPLRRRQHQPSKRARRWIASPRAGRRRRSTSIACCPTPGRLARAATMPEPARSTRASSAWRREHRRPRWQRWRSA